MKKNLILASLIFSLCACSGGNGGNDSQTTSQPNSPLQKISDSEKTLASEKLAEAEKAIPKKTPAEKNRDDALKAQVDKAVAEIALADKKFTKKIQLAEKVRNKIKEKHPGWDDAACDAVAKHAVHKGMTTEQSRAAWGKPYTINKTIYGNDVHEQWVMSEYGGSYLYFENGILTTIQTSE